MGSQGLGRGSVWAGLASKALLALSLLLTGRAWSTETTTYVLTDVQGTVLAREDAHGTTIAEYDYRPYGQVQAGPATAGPGYTGHVSDPDTGLVYMQARYYDPEMGRFVSADPLGPTPGNASNFNRYGYASDNPVVNIDPDGKQEESAEVLEAENRAAMQRLRPNLGPNMAIQSPFVQASGESDSDFAARQEYIFEQMCSTPEKLEGERNKIIYTTYTKTNPDTGQVYSGRTSGTATPEENVSRRDSGHHMNEKGFGPAVIDVSSKNKDAIRGREQQLIEFNGGAQSQGGTSGNMINGISPQNKNIDRYLEAAKEL